MDGRGAAEGSTGGATETSGLASDGLDLSDDGSMISTKYQFLFVHVPKTGGNSIQDALREHADDELVCLAAHQDGVERFEVRNRKYDLVKHSTLRDYKRELEPDFFARLYKFATLRNPWEVMVSFYFSPHAGRKEWDRATFAALVGETPVFRHYVNLEAEPGMLRKLTGRGYSTPLDHDLDFIIRYETLEADFRRVCERVGLPAYDLPHRNKSSRAHYTSYYDEELVELVKRRFAEEIEWGGYRFGE